MRRRYNDDVRKNKMLAKFSFQQQQHEVKNAIMIFSSARSVKFRVLTTLKFFHLNFFSECFVIATTSARLLLLHSLILLFNLYDILLRGDFCSVEYIGDTTKATTSLFKI